jgi:Zn-dependent M28 family amino/carboxypeptidase
MQKISLILCLALLLGASPEAWAQRKKKKKQSDTASTPVAVSVNADQNALRFAATISAEDLRRHAYALASDSLEGRMTGTLGQKKAAYYLAQQFHKNRLKPIVYDSSAAAYQYFQAFNVVKAGYRYGLVLDPKKHKEVIQAENVVGLIEGTDLKDEVIVVSAHYDHVGVSRDKIYYGADDNASGTSTVLEVAEAFAEAAKAGFSPRRSILFLLVSGEEIGLFGSSFYADYQPLFPLKNTVANLNIDMVGRVDSRYKDKTPDYVYLIGSDKLSKDLHKLHEQVNTTYTQLTLDYTYNSDNDPNQYYYRSDHYNFAKNDIPVIFYFNGEHEDYHQPTDTPDKLNYQKMEKIARLVFHTTWEIANREERIRLDSKK